MAKDFAIPRRYPNIFIIHCLAQFDAETIRCDDLERELGTGTTSYVVMSLAHKTLAGFVSERPPLPERHVLLLMLQLASAIAHLNRHGVAHRDLKLDNIVITSVGKVRRRRHVVVGLVGRVAQLACADHLSMPTTGHAH